LPDTEIAWSSRVSQQKIRRLYETDARRILDEDLLDEVGISLYARCESILALTDAYRGRVHCPRCRAVILMQIEGRQNVTPIRCGCGWETRWLAYKKTVPASSMTSRDKRLRAGNAERVFEAFVDSYPRARSPRERMVLIDSLLHEFHRSRKGESGPAAVNVIEGSRESIVAMLDDLFSSENRASREALWRVRLRTSDYGRRMIEREESGNTGASASI